MSKEEIKDIRLVVEKLLEKYNTLVDAFNKAKWIEKTKEEITFSVYNQIEAKLQKAIKKAINEAFEEMGLQSKLLQSTINKTPVS